MGAYSKLHEYTYSELRRNFPHFTLRENTRPEWLLSSKLTRLELDIYIEELNTAIEIQGSQHYSFTPHFHKTYDHFREQVRRDREKRELCYGKGVKLIEVAEALDVKLFIMDLKEKEKIKADNLPKYSYADTAHIPIEAKRIIEKKSTGKNKKAVDSARPVYSIAHKKELNRIRKEQKKKKRAYLISKGIIIIQQAVILPGSHLQRNHARKIHCSQITKNLWYVWGGDNGIHKVTRDGEYSCDCYHYTKNKSLCSHIVRVRMYERDFPVVPGTDKNMFHIP